MRTTPALDAAGLERVGVALADPTRRRIVARLFFGTAYPAILAQELGISRANVSNHLACLRGCGLVVAAPEGRRVRYALADRRVADALRQLVSAVLDTDGASAAASRSPAGSAT